MCLTFCHRRGEEGILFWNHVDCQPEDCGQARVGVVPGYCVTCPHRCEVPLPPAAGSAEPRTEQRCGLTDADLPTDGYCCHYGVELTVGPVCVQRMLGYPNAYTYDEAAVRALLERQRRVWQQEHRPAEWLAWQPAGPDVVNILVALDSLQVPWEPQAGGSIWLDLAELAAKTTLPLTFGLGTGEVEVVDWGPPPGEALSAPGEYSDLVDGAFG